MVLQIYMFAAPCVSSSGHVILYETLTGSVELAAVGVSVSIFNLVSKLFNVPLLNVTTSFVAEQQALECSPESNDHAIEAGRNSVLSVNQHVDFKLT